jgi:RNA-directed DNA polymerase
MFIFDIIRICLCLLISQCEAFGGTRLSFIFLREISIMQRINIYNEEFFYESILRIDDKNTLYKTLEKKENYYEVIEIPKKNGIRVIHCISKNSPLYYLQDQLRKNFLEKIPCSTSACGFIKGSSYKDFLIPHQNMEYYLRIDIKDFFNSIKKDKIKEVLRQYLKLNNEKSNEILNYISELVTIDSYVPQGAVTSPQISNIIFRKLDVRLQKYCQKLNINYTRYADDLLFSSKFGKVHLPFFLNTIRKILLSENFLINKSKIIKTRKEISLSGFTVGRNIRLSRSRKGDLTKVLFLFNQGGKPKSINQLLERLNSETYRYRMVRKERNKNYIYFTSKESILNYLAGYRALLIDWGNPNKYKSLKDESKLILRIEKVIKDISQLS